MNTEIVLLGHSVKSMISVMQSLLFFLVGQGPKLGKHRAMCEGSLPLPAHSDKRNKQELLLLIDVVCEDIVFHI